MSWFRRQREATNQQVAASGAGGWAVDDIDREAGYHRVGAAPGRPVPDITLEKAHTNSVAGYRTNPMARAIIDTYVAFCVGDSGVSLEVADPLVREVAEAHWNDPKVALGTRQELELRSHLLYGESCYEALVGAGRTADADRLKRELKSRYPVPPIPQGDSEEDVALRRLLKDVLPPGDLDSRLRAAEERAKGAGAE